jgi:glycosyltransferase involved in cell wall biosynthesis
LSDNFLNNFTNFCTTMHSKSTKKRLSVLFLADLHPNKLGSIEEFVIFLTKKLTELGHHCILAFASEPPDWLAKRFREVGAKLEIIDLGSGLFNQGKSNRKNLKSAWQLYRIIRKNKINLVHVNFLPFSHPVMLGIYFSPRTKLIYTDHTSGEIHQQRWQPDINRKSWLQDLPTRTLTAIQMRIKQLLIHLFGYFRNRRVTTFIAVSNYVRHRLITSQKIKPEKVITIYNGVNINRFNVTGHFRQELNIPVSLNVISTVGMLIPEKGIQYILAAIPQIITVISDIVLLIVGEGYYKNTLDQIIERLKIEKYVRFLGVRSDVEKIYAISDVVVIPSVWQEAFGLANIEAMASRKPVVATSVGGIPEIIETYKNGILIPSQNSEAIAQAVIRLFQNSELYTEIARNARKKVIEQFNLELVVDQTVNLYYKTISR